jgi:hypothetical protein
MEDGGNRLRLCVNAGNRQAWLFSVLSLNTVRCRTERTTIRAHSQALTDESLV